MKRVPWFHVENLVKRVNPVLCRLINEISPTDDLSFLLADYRYGDHILKAGELVDRCSDDSLSTLIDAKQLPCGVVLSRGLELFIDDQQQIMPINIYRSGQCFSFANYFNANNQPYLNLTAGARTTFLLPNVSDIVHHRKLINIYKAPAVPKTLYDHWHVFKKIANYRFQNRFWQATVLFFSKAWLQRLASEQSLPWLRLKNYLLQQASKHNQPLSSLLDVRLLKNKLIYEVAAHHLSMSQYTINAACHVLAMQKGELLGFQIASGDECFMPEELIQQAYLDDYRLKNYLPVIMHPGKWTAGQTHFPLYYSLNFPTSLLQPCIEMKNLRRTELLQQMRQALQLMRCDDVSYQFMHQNQDDLGDVGDVNQVLSNDPSLQLLKQKYPDGDVACSSRFVRGCICVSKQATQAIAS